MVNEKPHIRIPDHKVSKAPKPVRWGSYVYSRSRAHRQVLAKELGGLLTQAHERPRDAIDRSAYFVIEALGDLKVRDLRDLGIRIHVTEAKQVPKPPEDPERVGGKRQDFDVPAVPEDVVADDESSAQTWLYSAVASIRANEFRQVYEIAARKNQPGTAFENVIELHEWQNTGKVSARFDGETSCKMGFLQGLGATTYEAYEGFLRRAIGPKVTRVFRTAADLEVIAKLTKEESLSLAEALPGLQEISNAPIQELDAASAGASVAVPLGLPTVPVDAPAVCVIDTGAAKTNPWMAAVLAGERSYPSTLAPGDNHGHGTGTAGLAAYHYAFSTGKITAVNRIFAAKVIEGDKADLDLGTLVPEILRDHKGKCRVFTMSINSPDTSRVRTREAEAIDEAVRDQDVVFINSVGNVNSKHLLGLYKDGIKYPEYYLDPDIHDVRLQSPASGINIVSVGSISATSRLTSVAPKGHPAPHTRYSNSPFGPDCKPDLVEAGGNFTLTSAGAPEVDFAHCPPTLQVPGTPAVDNKSNFAARIGTSFSAPLVAWSAAQLAARFPGASANMLRALLMVSAVDPAPTLRQDLRKRALLGLGVPSLKRAEISASNRVLFMHEGRINVNQCETVRFFLPKSFADDKRDRMLRACLVYDPPVDRNERKEYSVVNIRPTLHTTDERRPKLDDDHNWSTHRYHSVRYGAWSFSKSSQVIQQQSNTDWSIQLTPSLNRLSQKYQPGDITHQRYALVISMESDNPQAQYYEEVQTAWKLDVQVPTKVGVSVTSQ